MLRAIVVFVGVAAAGTASSAKTDPAALEASRRWLGAVASGDVTILRKATSLPFVFATTAKVKRCEGEIADQQGMSAWLDCLRRNDNLLLEEIRQGTLLPADPPNVESKSLRTLSSKITAKGTWLEAFINGQGVTYTFRFLLVGDSVAALLVDPEYEKG